MGKNIKSTKFQLLLPFVNDSKNTIATVVNFEQHVKMKTNKENSEVRNKIINSLVASADNLKW